ncbi:MAG: alcohol dehydrogenase catalytic domain-containing protein [Anaerolineae bacterium]
MKAAVLHGVHDLRLQDLPDPEPASNEVLIRVEAAGLCGTDVHMWEGTNQEGTFPFVPGHEWSGEVVEVGKDVKMVSIGDRVVAEVPIPCHICDNCKDGMEPNMCPDFALYGFSWENPGGMAEYTLAREERLFKIPDNVSYEEASLVEPVSVAYHGVWGSGGGAAPHDRVVVFGAGPIGLFAMLSCKASGAPVIVVEPQPFRRRMARDLGADVTLDPTDGNLIDQVMDHTGGRGATMVLECSGSNGALAATLDIIAKQGRIVLIGQSAGRKIPIEIGQAIFQRTTIVGSSGSPYFFPKTLTFMSRRLVDLMPIVTHRFPLSQVLDAFELGKSGADCAKILVLP